MRPSEHSRAMDDLIDEASMESFPASDPPAYRSMSIGGPAAWKAPPPRPVAGRLVAGAQSAYFVAAGLTPFASRRAFERLTGRKRDWWLVQRVGVSAMAVGVALGLAAARDAVTPAVRVAGVASAAGLGMVGGYHALRGRISRVYLLDAVVEAGLVAGWIASAMAERKWTRRP